MKGSRSSFSRPCQDGVKASHNNGQDLESEGLQLHRDVLTDVAREGVHQSKYYSMLCNWLRAIRASNFEIFSQGRSIIWIFTLFDVGRLQLLVANFTMRVKYLNC